MKQFNIFTKALTSIILLFAAGTVYAQSFSGTYLVGPGQTYLNLSNSTTGILPKMASQGVSGPVTILIMPGSYSGSDWQASIGVIPGVSAVNTVIIKPQTTSGSVTLSFQGTSTSNNYVIQFNGCSYITLQDLILSNSATSTSYGKCVDFLGTSSYNTVTGCTLRGTLTSAATSANTARVYASGHTGTNNTISNNTIECNGYGIYWFGSSTSFLSGNPVFSGNTIRQVGTTAYASAIYSYYTAGLKVLTNTITSSTNVASTFYGIYLNYDYNGAEVQGNSINISKTSTGSLFGLYAYGLYRNIATSKVASIKNNTVTLTSTSTSSMYPYYHMYCSYDTFMNNNATATNTYTSGYIYNYMGYFDTASYMYNNTLTATANYYTYQYLGYYCPDIIFRKNNVQMTNNGNGYMYNYNFFYAPRAQVDSNILYNIKNGSNGYLYANGSSGYGFFTYSTKSNARGNDIRNMMPTTTNYYNYCGLSYYSDTCLFDGNTVMNVNRSTSYYVYDYMNYYSNRNLFTNNLFVDSAGYYNYGIYMNYYSNDTRMQNNFFRNSVTGGSTGYLYFAPIYYGNNDTFINNTVRLTNTNSSGYLYHYMMYGGMNHMFAYNDIQASATLAYYGYTYQGSASYANGTIAYNKFDLKALTSSTTMYGMYLQYPNSLNFHNNAINVTGNGTTYGLYSYYPYGGVNNFYNNTISTTSTSTNVYTVYDYNPGSYGGLTKWNNNIINMNGANSSYPPFYFYNKNYCVGSDYNLVYNAKSGGPLFGGSNNPSGNFNTVAQWRAAVGFDMNSLTYNPGLMDPSNGDLRPDPNNSNSWSVQGRGVHIPGNNKDVLGNTRALLPGQGVPDLGAYEFTPVATAPFAVANPATPVASSAQTFTFGEDTVAVINWGAAPPTNAYVKQYTGIQPPANFTAFNATAMYLYDSIGVSGTSDNYTIQNYYKDPWIGTIASESSLHLAKNTTLAPGNWTGYPFTQSSPNTVRNFINTTNLTSFGYYTGMDIPNNAGTVAIAEPSGTFCAGQFTVKVKIANNGNNVINNVKVNWQVPPGPPTQISYNTPIPVYTGVPGSNEALVTLGVFNITPAGTNLDVWTSLPNGVADPANTDDTLHTVLRSAFSGVFTVGGTSPDFPTVTAAVNALKAYGVCGPTVFNIRQGTYIGRYDLPTVSGMNPVNRVTFQADASTGANVNNVMLAYGSASTSDGEVIKINNASFFTFRNLSITNTGTTYGYGFNYVGNPREDSVVGCKITSASALGSSYSAPVYSNFSGKAAKNVFIDNDMNANGGYYGIYWYNSAYTDSSVFINNTIRNFYYYLYIYYTNRIKFIGNTITPLPGYGYYSYFMYAYQSPEIRNNKWLGWENAYYMYFYYFNGVSNSDRAKISNNTVVWGKSNATNYYLYMYYPSYADFWNNTFVSNSTASSYYAPYLYNPNYCDFRNNIFANMGGQVMYYYNGTGNTMDYNLYYNSSTTQFAIGSWTAANFNAWRNSSGFDKNSLFYRPGFDTTTGVPDLNDPRSWAMANRGVQIAGNNLDINGNARIDQLVNGAPDIGAYEFEPQVQPPVATATPANPVPGGIQTFMFGTDTVARVKWSSTLLLTSPLEVRRYQGRVAPGWLSVSPNRYMYFYTDIRPTAPGTTYNFGADVYYMDIWNGRIQNESNLMLTHKSPTTPSWIIYNQGASSVNTSRNILYGASLMNFGVFTGVDTQVVFSAIATALGSTVFCTGGNVVLSANTGINYTYQWYRNGSPINGATNSTYTATQAGDYHVVITSVVGSTTYTASSVTITVSVMAPPMALTTASGSLIYCTGTNLSLNVTSGAGLTYQWFLNGTPAPGTSTNPTYVVGAAGTYTVQVSNIGCTTTSLPMVVTPGPLVVNLGPDITGCEVKNQAYILDAGHPGAKFSWSTGDTTQKIYITKTAGPQNYTVTVDAGGAGCIASDQVSVNIRPLPSVTGISYIQSGTTYIFTASGAQNVSTYHWIFNDQGTMKHDYTPAPAPVHFSASMVATLIVCNECGCDTINIVNWATGINTGGKGSFNVSLFPNPASDKVTFAIEGTPRIKDITVVNSLGEVVYKETLNGEQTKEVDVTKLAQGHYLLRATTNEGTITKPFNIVR